MSDQWRGPGWWVADDGMWYPPDGDAESAEIRWERRSGWIDEADAAADTRAGPISTGTSILEAATGQNEVQPMPDDDRQLVLDEAFEVIDLRARYRQELLAADGSDIGDHTEEGEPESADMELVSAIPESGEGSRTADPVSVAPPPTIVPPSIDEASAETGAETTSDRAPVSERPPSVTEDRRRVDDRRSEPAPSAEEPRRRSRSGPILLLLATALAVTSGVLGALWVRERDSNDELELRLAQIQAADDATSSEIQELADQVTTLEIRNEQLDKQLQEAQSLVAPVPEGRLSIIDIPFDPLYVDEVRGQFIAMGVSGEYVVWGGGVDSQITDSGVVEGSPTGMYAARDQAFVSTDAGQVEILSLTGGENSAPIVTGSLQGLVQDNRQFWAFSPDSNELRRYRSTNGRLTTSVALPTSVNELSVGAGAVWALGDDGMIYRVNTADFTLTPISAGQDLIAISAGPDALWTLSAADGSLRRVDAVSGEVLVTVPVGRDPVDAVYSGNSVWVALRSGSTLIEVDTRTSAVVSRTSLPAEPVALSEGETGVLVTLNAEDPLVRVASG